MKPLFPALRQFLHTSFLLLLLGGSPVVAADGPKLAPLMSTPGASLINDTFADSLPTAWKAGKGTWVTRGGVLRGTELAADEHGAVVRRTVTFKMRSSRFPFASRGAHHQPLDHDAKGPLCRLIVDPAVSRCGRNHEQRAGRTSDPFAGCNTPARRWPPPNEVKGDPVRK